MPEKNEINEELYKNHENRPDLAREHPIGDPLQLLFLIIFIGAIAVDYIFFQSYFLLSAKIPFLLRLPIGLALIASGGWLALKGIQIVFKDLRPEPVMITEGMFSKVRHPIYLGVMIVYVGILLITRSLLGAIVFIFVMILYNWLAKHEEKLMLGIFGDTYQEYIRQVPMWLPKLF
ncbi:MAG: isoprenylcysteine carboxylmethyltransferase family protein [Pelolinea sp.]|nr:isoprenylcysteine carboxylmethyltransferase family protein [Pelolinea sp.]